MDLHAPCDRLRHPLCALRTQRAARNPRPLGPEARRHDRGRARPTREAGLVNLADDSGLRVLIAGGGIAGLEALLALADMAEGSVNVTLVAPEPEFTYKPMIVDEPFSLNPAE